MKKLFTLLLFASLAVFPGCNSSSGNDDDGDNNGGGSDSGSGGSGSASTYLPFKANNTWTYTSTDGDETSSYTDTVIGSTTIEGKSYWMIQSVDSSAEADTSYMRIADNNLYSFLDTEMMTGYGKISGNAAKIAGAVKKSLEDYGDEVIRAKFGVSAGTTWSMVSTSVLTMTGKYIGLESVQTTAGNFSNCAKFMTTTTASGSVSGTSYSSTYVEYIWFAPNVGVVKDATSYQYKYGNQTVQSWTSTDTLKSYTVK